MADGYSYLAGQAHRTKLLQELSLLPCYGYATAWTLVCVMVRQANIGGWTASEIGYAGAGGHAGSCPGVMGLEPPAVQEHVLKQSVTFCNLLSRAGGAPVNAIRCRALETIWASFSVFASSSDFMSKYSVKRS